MGDLEAAIAQTKQVVGPMIAKPKMADKLLNKPPFRFIHDIFGALSKQYGFPPLEGNDADSASMTNKELKMEFLTKMSDLAAQNGKPVTVRPNKVVAGAEPENTNALITAIALIARDGPGGGAPKAEPEAPKAQPPAPAPAPAAEEAPAPAQAPARRAPPPKPQEDEQPPARPSAASKPRQPEPEADAAQPPPPPARASRLDRPQTARRPPPAARPVTRGGQQGAASGATAAPARVIADGGADSEEEEDDKAGVGNAVAADLGGTLGFGDFGNLAPGGGAHGRVVSDIMRMNGAGEEQHMTTTSGGSVADEVLTLRNGVQKMTQATAPLARCVDYVQEDVESMMREKNRWQKESANLRSQLDEARRVTEREIDKLQAKLHEKREAVREQRARVVAARATCLRNEQKIRGVMGTLSQTA